MLKVMTFNIRGFHNADGENVWEKRAQINTQTILKAAPDIIGFQELMPGNQEHYDKTLQDYDFELGPRVSMENDQGIWEHPAIYWRRERFTLLDCGHYYLNETPERYAVDWNAVQGRGLNWVRLRDRNHDIEFIFMNTHFSHVSEEARVKSAHLICQRTNELFPARSVILTGDFNTTPQMADVSQSSENTPYAIFMNAGFRDTLETDFVTGAGAPTHTFHNYAGEQYHNLQRRIDWILYRDGSSKMRVENTIIIRDAMPPIYPSDHYPVVATFNWK